MRSTSRRSFVVAAGSSLASIGAVRAPARAAQFEFKAAHVQAVNTPMHVWTVRLWEQVERETNGRLVVRVFPDSQLGGADALMSQLRLGAIQFLSIGNGSSSDYIP